MKILFRIIVDLLIFAAIFIVPWWLSLVLICAGIFWFGYFYESLIFALLLDGFHGIPGITFFGINAFFITIIGLVFLISLFLKTRLKFY